MQGLSDVDFLNLWERGAGLHHLDRGLLSLGAAFPQTPCEVFADWPLGRRNSALAQLHCVCFGSGLQGEIRCPQCAEKLEFRMDASVLVKEGPATAARVEVKGRSFRLPSTRDLARAVRESTPRLAAIQLVESCCAEEIQAPDWSDDDLEEIGEKLASADPLAEIRLTFHCDQCNHEWAESLDIAAFLWLEIEARARRLLRAVHTLAAAYGWSEREILSLSEPRRQLYLEMVRE